MQTIIRRILGIAFVAAVAAGVLVAVLHRLGEVEAEVESIGRIHQTRGYPVAVRPPEVRDFIDYIHVDGEVVADVRSVLRAKVGEVVQAVHVRAGEEVKEGQLLVELRTTDLESDIQAARATYEEARSRHRRQLNLFEQEVVSEDALEAARTAMENAASALRRAESQLEFAKVYSPIDGVVQRRFVEPGELAAVGTELLVVIQLERLEVRAAVPEQFVPRISVGRTAEFRLEAEPEWLSGAVSRISPSTEDIHRFFDVFLAADNRRTNDSWLMRPGMYAEVRFVRRSASDAIAVPDRAIVQQAGERYLFVVESATETVRVPVADQPEAEPDDSFTARLQRGLRRLARRQEQQQEQRMEEKEMEVARARRVEVDLGLREGELVQLRGEPIGADSRVVLNPHEDLSDGDMVRVVEEGE